MTFAYKVVPVVQCARGTIVRYGSAHWTVANRDRNGKLVRLIRGNRETWVQGKTRVGRLR